MGKGIGVRARHVWGDSGVRNEDGDGSDVGDDAGDLDRGRVDT